MGVWLDFHSEDVADKRELMLGPSAYEDIKDQPWCRNAKFHKRGAGDTDEDLLPVRVLCVSVCVCVFCLVLLLTQCPACLCVCLIRYWLANLLLL